jgi:hypothetical protein
MKRSTLILAAAAVIVAAGAATSLADDPWGGHHAKLPRYTNPWHGAYYYPGYNQPVALVVPPTAGMHTDWSWGMGGTRISAIWHQFQRPYPGTVGVSGGFLPRPVWPSDTAQMGVYYVRGPW